MCMWNSIQRIILLSISRGILTRSLRGILPNYQFAPNGLRRSSTACVATLRRLTVAPMVIRCNFSCNIPQLTRSMCIGILRLYVMLGYWSTYGLVLKVFDNAMQAHGWPQLSCDIKRVDSCQNSRQIWCTCHRRLRGKVIVDIFWNKINLARTCKTATVKILMER